VETPLLDRREAVPAMTRRKKALLVLLGGAIGAAFDFVAIHYGWFDHVGSFLLAAIPAFFLVVLIHELGHLAATRVVGFEWRHFYAGPLIVDREANGVRVRFLWKRLLFGGMVQAAPDSARDLRRRYLIMLAGGPIATALVFAVVPLLPHGIFRSCLAAANVLAVATSWIPCYTGGYATDAKAILLLRRPGHESNLLAAILYIAALDAQGVVPRDWDAASVEALRTPVGSPLDGTAAVFMLAHAFDASDDDGIAAATERALGLVAQATAAHRRAIFDTAAYVQAIYRYRADLAGDARKVKGAVVQPDWDAATMGAIARVSGNAAEAEAHFRRAIARLDRHPGVSGSIQAARVRLATLALVG
jgi:hypothetical protein